MFNTPVFLSLMYIIYLLQIITLWYFTFFRTSTNSSVLHTLSYSNQLFGTSYSFVPQPTLWFLPTSLLFHIISNVFTLYNIFYVFSTPKNIFVSKNQIFVTFTKNITYRKFTFSILTFSIISVLNCSFCALISKLQNANCAR